MTRIFLICLIILNLHAKKEDKMNNISLENSGLVLIEYQNEWLNEGTKLSKLMKDKIQFKNSIENSKKVLSYARKLGLNIIHVPLMISDDYKEFGNNAKYGLRAIIPKVKTWQGNNKDFHEDFKPLKKEFIVSGRIGASGFANSNLDAILRNNGIENIFLIGYATNVCVDSTMREAHDKGYNTTIISDATSSFTKEEQEHFLEYIVHHFAAKITTQEFLSLKPK
ncbi:isochorismatase [Malaciobacter marinus]|uniref:Isochorismatase n=1 Tax=Malaciobacter marinus TaxID=505249 RepID=A0A347TH32_9BACT|nr:cysteine hydrolase [Malaciobacter marinus]AXX85910.1 isochorismatase [Malaciobacter marinus]PHO14969.1 isochorismatase [Malaciobacter marinus]